MGTVGTSHGSRYPTAFRQQLVVSSSGHPPVATRPENRLPSITYLFTARVVFFIRSARNRTGYLQTGKSVRRSRRGHDVYISPFPISRGRVLINTRVKDDGAAVVSGPFSPLRQKNSLSDTSLKVVKETSKRGFFYNEIFYERYFLFVLTKKKLLIKSPHRLGHEEEASRAIENATRVTARNGSSDLVIRERYGDTT